MNCKHCTLYFSRDQESWVNFSSLEFDFILNVIHPDFEWLEFQRQLFHSLWTVFLTNLSAVHSCNCFNNSVRDLAKKISKLAMKQNLRKSEPGELVVACLLLIRWVLTFSHLFRSAGLGEGVFTKNLFCLTGTSSSQVNWFVEHRKEIESDKKEISWVGNYQLTAAAADWGHLIRDLCTTIVSRPISSGPACQQEICKPQFATFWFSFVAPWSLVGWGGARCKLHAMLLSESIISILRFHHLYISQN